MADDFSTALSHTFSSMDEIGRIVDESLTIEDLQLIASKVHSLGNKLAIYAEETGRSTPGWVVKKAHDALSSKLWAIHQAMNDGAGLPADYLG